MEPVSGKTVAGGAIVFGILFGVVIGAMMDNIALGIPIGIALGIAFWGAGAATRRRGAVKNDSDGKWPPSSPER
jgi:F0F1-type ATP synthase assembly protein I